MGETVKYGIDLGTTNSLIARYHQGKVEVFKNPVGHKETLPSVIAFRKDKIIIGDKAREYIEKDPHNVFGSFKRKMGTSETFRIRSLDKEINPIELSSIVLKELKNFVYTGEQVDAAVITIPASFDTVQSNATKKAGLMAGFEEVYLLQEPIAASLAYANREENKEDTDGQWLVYDLGGGTFDVALVKIQDGEMKVTDHQGDNFLGGVDLDNLIIEKIVIPYLHRSGTFTNLEQEMKSASGKYNKLYYRLLKLAEDAKVVLSGKDNAEMEFEIEDDKGDVLDAYFSFTRNEFESIISEKIKETINMMSLVLERNNLKSEDIRFVLLVGGSTYIPLVRKLITDATNIPVNCQVDPTTAVAEGAAYFAGSKPRKNKEVKQTAETETGSSLKRDFSIKTAYQKASQDMEEYFVAKAEGNFSNLFYRITRDDGGYDSGTKQLSEKISEYLPLVKDFYNYFTFKVYDQHNTLVSTDLPKIEIVQGKYNVLGQPLPNDLCIEVDDFASNATKLELIFDKNSILPLKRTITKEITKTLTKGSDESVIINVLEGPRFALPSSNISIGSIEISGKDLKRDLLKGSDIEIILEVSESRDLRITTVLMMTDQEFSNLFSPSERHVNIGKLKDEIFILRKKAIEEVRSAEKREDYETAAKLANIREDIDILNTDINKLRQDDVTDTKFQMEDKKRKFAAKIDDLTRDKVLTEVINDYYISKKGCKHVVTEYGSEEDKKNFENLIADEKQFLSTANIILIKSITDKIHTISFKLNWKRPEYIISLFYYYSGLNEYPDRGKADQLREAGEKAMQRQNYDELKVIITNLFHLLPEAKKEKMKGTGIG
ncbi:MAG: Hsp70 family protein [Cytophagaceae bacterium]